ncbi:5'-methylthioadenosine/adenosylhomocysteine nucleosidase [Erysipelothrix anatis]|uniref:5'-methylthioadenosine/adenosylhomocysteine nucleosidase n=1 Tax=Erysipelothrix anatis TaxID=2683713 RepID=UPI00135B4D51|nr:5'-methylthioadenosine/adenosylhomocysteine nucleosidase [Erysipelothrix anatis]
MILIIGAMIEEVSALTHKMKSVHEQTVQGINVWEGLLSDQTVTVALSGVGKVNAAYTASVLIHALKPEVVINIGSAGGLQKGQNIGDVVVAEKLQYHDLDIGPTTHEDPRFIFYSDEKLMKKATETLKTLEMPYHQGLIVTGDQFITKHQPQFNVIQQTFPHAICVEMEAAAIAAVCARSKTPFIVLRSLSDVTFIEGNEISFDEYLPTASANSAKICELFVKNF